VRALIVDDSKTMRVILARILRELEFEVDEAPDGQQALALLESKAHPDVALVDWNMPEMNGFELVQAVRANRAFDAIRLMMVTTETELAHVAKALEAGANEYVMKPFTKDAIREKLALLGVVQG
jgi:two-component system chemotaxis response regulator CheY